METDVKFWEESYINKKTGWDLGTISPPIMSIINQLNDKNLHILIPGAGNAYEAEYLFKHGFCNTYVVDVSETALNNFAKRCPDFPKKQILHQDFFELKMKFDLILEQTCLCAIPPAQRTNYAAQMASLLSSGNKLQGVLFDFPLTENGPPYGGSKEEYIRYFTPYFKINQLKKSDISHPLRANKELLIKFTRL